MALPSISVDDFVGEIRLSKDPFGSVDASDYIEQNYPQIIRMILGDYAYSEIRDSDPLPQKWADLMNGLTYTDSEGNVWISDGLVKASKYWLWCDIFAQDFQNTPAGNAVNMNENSSRLSGGTVSVISATRFNKGVRIAEEAYCFLNEFWKIVQQWSAVTDNSDNTYTFEVASTKYLAVGDKVFSGDKELTVTDIVEDSQVTADAGAIGLSFDPDLFWEPFKKYKMPLPVIKKSSAF